LAQETRSQGDVPAASGAGDALTEVEVEVLAFAGLLWRYPGAMETAVREKFDWSLTRYFQVLNGLLDRPEAYVHAPVLVARLRRLREARAAVRAPGRGADAAG
jgi:hypothetical protein